mgnify:CR=1 FL=1
MFQIFYFIAYLNAECKKPRDGVKDTYGYNGHESVPPPVILKMMLLLVFYDLRSERELVQTIAERLDWLWFLDKEKTADSNKQGNVAKSGIANKKHISATDPDASVIEAISTIYPCVLVYGKKWFNPSFYVLNYAASKRRASTMSQGTKMRSSLVRQISPTFSRRRTSVCTFL